jgi:hypothetical protein
MNEDYRPVLVCDDVIDLNINGLTGTTNNNSASFIELINCVNGSILNSSSSEEVVEIFLHLKGDKTKNIKLNIFDKSDLVNKIKFSRGAEKEELKIN